MSNTVNFTNKEELQKAIKHLLRGRLRTDLVVYHQDVKKFLKLLDAAKKGNRKFSNLLSDYRQLLPYFEPAQSGY